MGSSAPTWRRCVILGSPAPCPSRRTSPQPTRLARSSSAAAKIEAEPRSLNMPAQDLANTPLFRRDVRERASGIGPRLTQQLPRAWVSAAASHSDSQLTPHLHHRVHCSPAPAYALLTRARVSSGHVLGRREWVTFGGPAWPARRGRTRSPRAREREKERRGERPRRHCTN